jgi:hypothetical protein
VDGTIFANSLISLTGKDLRMVYALLCKTNIGHLLSSKTKDIFSSEEGDHFTKHLEAEVEKLDNFDDEVLQVNLFLELTRLLKLRGTKYSLQKEIEDQCTHIINDVYLEYKKQDKHFRLFTSNQSNSNKLQQMVTFQMSKVFSSLDGSFQDFSIENQTKFAAQVNDYIQSLPEEKQVKIKEKLGINDLTDEMVRNVIATSGTSIVFAIIVEVSGFAFYTTATSLVATFAGLFGLTLPFGFYTGLTSTIAVLANPLFIIPLVLGGGALLVNLQNRSLKKKLLPIIVMQIALPYMSKDSESISFHSFIQEWEKRYEKKVTLHTELGKIVSEKKDVQDRIAVKETIIKEYLKQMSEAQNQLQLEKQRIQSDLESTNLDLLQISDPFLRHKCEYQKTIEEIGQLENSKKSGSTVHGFFERIGNTFSNFSTSFDIRDKEKQAVSTLEKMVEDILLSNSSYMQAEREQVKRLNGRINHLKIVKKAEELSKKELEEMLKKLIQQQHNFTQKLSDHEKENYGLEHLLMT